MFSRQTGGNLRRSFKMRQEQAWVLCWGGVGGVMLHQTLSAEKHGVLLLDSP